MIVLGDTGTNCSVDVLAPAKINLSLALRHRNKKGYHVLDSLVGFLDFADHLHLHPSQHSTLRVIGTEPTVNPEDNIALKALRRLEEHGVAPHDIVLRKNIYAGAGLGGGSADAAAVLRALGQNVPTETLYDIALELGADVPVCLLGKPARMQGIGEKLTAIADFPIKYLVLVAPEVALSTAKVFGQESDIVFSTQIADPMQPESWHNDLEAAACGLCPELNPILARLRTLDKVLAAGMSGTGVCCFAALPCQTTQQQAIKALQNDFPNVRIRAATLLSAQDV